MPNEELSPYLQAYLDKHEDVPTGLGNHAANIFTKRDVLDVTPGYFQKADETITDAIAKAQVQGDSEIVGPPAPPLIMRPIKVAAPVAELFMPEDQQSTLPAGMTPIKVGPPEPPPLEAPEATFGSDYLDRAYNKYMKKQRKQSDVSGQLANDPNLSAEDRIRLEGYYASIKHSAATLAAVRTEGYADMNNEAKLKVINEERVEAGISETSTLPEPRDFLDTGAKVWNDGIVYTLAPYWKSLDRGWENAKLLDAAWRVHDGEATIDDIGLMSAFQAKAATESAGSTWWGDVASIIKEGPSFIFEMSVGNVGGALLRHGAAKGGEKLATKIAGKELADRLAGMAGKAAATRAGKIAGKAIAKPISMMPFLSGRMLPDLTERMLPEGTFKPGEDPGQIDFFLAEEGESLAQATKNAGVGLFIEIVTETSGGDAIAKTLGYMGGPVLKGIMKTKFGMKLVDGIPDVIQQIKIPDFLKRAGMHSSWVENGEEAMGSALRIFANWAGMAEFPDGWEDFTFEQYMKQGVAFAAMSGSASTIGTAIDRATTKTAPDFSNLPIEKLRELAAKESLSRRDASKNNVKVPRTTEDRAKSLEGIRELVAEHDRIEELTQKVAEVDTGAGAGVIEDDAISAPGLGAAQHSEIETMSNKELIGFIVDSDGTVPSSKSKKFLLAEAHKIAEGDPDAQRNRIRKTQTEAQAQTKTKTETRQDGEKEEEEASEGVRLRREDDARLLADINKKMGVEEDEALTPQEQAVEDANVAGLERMDRTIEALVPDSSDIGATGAGIPRDVVYESLGLVAPPPNPTRDDHIFRIGLKRMRRGRAIDLAEPSLAEKLARALFFRDSQSRNLDPEGLLGPSSGWSEKRKRETLKKFRGQAVDILSSVQEELTNAERQAALPLLPQHGAGSKGATRDDEAARAELKEKLGKAVKSLAIDLGLVPSAGNQPISLQSIKAMRDVVVAARKVGVSTLEDMYKTVKDVLGDKWNASFKPTIKKAWNEETNNTSAEDDTTIITPPDPADTTYDKLPINILEDPDITPGKEASIVNAFVEDERANHMDAQGNLRPLEQILSKARQGWGETWSIAMAKIDDHFATRGTDLGDDLVTELMLKPRAINAWETAVILRHKLMHLYKRDKLFVEIDKKYADVDDSGNVKDVPGLAELLRVETDMTDRITEIDKVSRHAGTESARALVIRKMITNQEYSVESMMNLVRRASGKADLPAHIKEQVREEHRKIRTAQVALDKGTAGVDKAVSDDAFERSYERLTRGKIDSKVKVAKKGSKRRAQLTKEIKELNKQLMIDWVSPKSLISMPVGMFRTTVKLAGKYAEAGVRDAAAFIIALKEANPGQDFEKFQRDIIRAWDIAVEKQKPTSPADMGNPLAVSRLANRLALYHIEQMTKEEKSAPKSKDLLVERVREDLQDYLPDITERETRDAISGHGEFRLLSKDENKVLLRQFRGEMRQASKLEELAEGNKGPYGNIERRDIGEVEKGMIKEFNAKRKAMGLTEIERDVYEKKYLSSYKKRKQKQIDEIERRIEAKDFAPHPPVEHDLDAEASDLKVKVQQAKDHFEAMRRKHEKENRTQGAKALGLFGDTLDTSRALLTSMDFSAVLRQGGILVASHPILATKAIRDMFKATMSASAALKSFDQIQERRNAALYMRAGLQFSSIDGKLTETEEVYRSEWGKRIPGVAASERAYVTFLNRLRADSFDNMASNLGVQGHVTLEGAQVLARYVNIATGKGGLVGFQKSSSAMAQIFFAPRFATSRFQYILGPFKHAAIMLAGANKQRAARMLIMKEYAKTITGTAVAMSLGAMFLRAVMGPGGEDEAWNISLNPISTDFGRIRIGDVRIDMLMGLQPAFVAVARLASLHKTSLSGKTTSLFRSETSGHFDLTSLDLFWKLLRNKAAPGPGAMANMLTGEDFLRRNTDIRTLEGALRVSSNLAVPISLSSFIEHSIELGVPKAVAYQLFETAGASATLYKN